jgi:hypothetical protein
MHVIDASQCHHSAAHYSSWSCFDCQASQPIGALLYVLTMLLHSARQCRSMLFLQDVLNSTTYWQPALQFYTTSQGVGCCSNRNSQGPCFQLAGAQPLRYVASASWSAATRFSTNSSIFSC